MDIKTFIANWIAAGNSYDIDKYLDCYLPDAVLDDPSVGRKFKGHKGIREYFTSYFIGYNTQTKLVKLKLKGNEASLEVEFTGDFPGHKLGGRFDLQFKEGKISFVEADLIQ